MSKPPWCRLYSEVLSDRKIEYICRKTQQPKVVILGAWSIFLALANDSPRRGALLLTEDISYTMVDLVGEMGLDLETGSDIIGAFFELGLLTDDGNMFHVTNFNKRNFTSDNSAERVREWRARQAKSEEESPNDYGKSNGEEALQDSYSNDDVTLPEAETKPDPEAKTDEEDPPSAPPPDPPPPRSKRKQPTPEQQASCAMFSALASTCEYDLNTITAKQRGQLNQSEKKLRKAGATPDDVLEFAEWWEENDWRGKKGEDPKPSQVREEWGRFKSWQEARREAWERAQEQGQPIEREDKSPAQVQWEALALDLSLQMTQATYDAWLAKAQATALENESLTVQLESKQALEWVTNRLARVVAATSERHGVYVEFVA